MEHDRCDARRPPRVSRLTIGRHFRARGEAATLVANAILCAAILNGVAAIVLASGVCASMATRAALERRPKGIDRNPLASLLRSTPSLRSADKKGLMAVFSPALLGRAAASAIALSLLASPAARAAGAPAPPIADADYAPYAAGATGTGVLRGTLAVRGPKGPIAAANVAVTAFPDTPYTRWYLGQRHDAMNQNGGMLPHQSDDSVIAYPAYDGKVAPDLRTTTSDARGRFAFARLPRGSYILAAQFATVATAYMPRQTEDASYGPASVDDFHAPPPNEFSENYFYLWLVGSKPIAVGAGPADAGKLAVWNGYFCGPLQRCTLVNDFASGGESRGDKLNRALGIGAKHGYERQNFEPVANPQDGVKAG